MLVQFVKFANIEEDTPSYHRRYDFFVSKFSAMCHCGTGTQVEQPRYVDTPSGDMKHVDN